MLPQPDPYRSTGLARKSRILQNPGAQRSAWRPLARCSADAHPRATLVEMPSPELAPAKASGDTMPPRHPTLALQ
eukprot:3442733-Karenia_brevis.AAC.1